MTSLRAIVAASLALLGGVGGTFLRSIEIFGPDDAAELGDNVRSRFMDLLLHVLRSPDLPSSFGKGRLRDEMDVSCIILLAWRWLLCRRSRSRCNGDRDGEVRRLSSLQRRVDWGSIVSSLALVLAVAR